MSKFWAEDEEEEEVSSDEDSGEYSSGEDDGSAEEDSGEESSSGEQEHERGAIQQFDSWESSEEEKRRVKTQGEKLEDALMTVRNNLRDIRDTGEDLKEAPEGTDTSLWPIVVSYSALKQEMETGLGYLKKYSREVKAHGVPGYFIKILADILSTVENVRQVAKDDVIFKEAISTTNWKALTSLSRWMEKAISQRFAKELAAHAAEPLAPRWADPEHEAEELAAATVVETKGGARRGTREFWVKKAGANSSDDEDDESSEEIAKPKGGRAERQARQREKKKVVAEEETPETPAEAEVTREEARDDLKPEDVDRLLREIGALRGLRDADYPLMIARYNVLLPKCFTVTQTLRCLFMITGCRFDAVSNIASRNISAEDWRTAVTDINTCVTLLTKNTDITLVPADLSAIDPDLLTPAQKALVEGGKWVVGSLLSHLQPLDTTFLRALRAIDPHTQEYVSRLEDDRSFVALGKRIFEYLVEIKDTKASAGVAVLLMSHVYYKPYADDGKRIDHTPTLRKWANHVYKYGTSKERTQAMLMSIYHLALQDKFEEARDSLLMSHLQETAHQMDVSTQILFNRVNVQLGLAAFRLGMVKQAHSCLSEVYAGGRIKELLAQGTSSQRYQDKDRELEKLERDRMLPYHMHINAEILESAHLISALLLEVPNLAQNGRSRGRVISKYLRKLLDYFDRQIFTGPPETTRDFVAAAAKSLSRGNWKKATQTILSMPGWDYLEDHSKKTVLDRLKQCIKDTAVTTYLFTFASVYDTMSLSVLAKLFELKESSVHATVSKMMIDGDLHASWNQPATAIVFHKIDPSNLQDLSLQHTAKLSQYVEMNERLLDQILPHGYKKGGKGRDDRGGSDNRDERKQHYKK